MIFVPLKVTGKKSINTQETSITVLSLVLCSENHPTSDTESQSQT